MRRLLAVVLIAALMTTAAVATTTRLLVQRAEASLTRVPVEELTEAPPVSEGPRNFLLVGSDRRESEGAGAEVTAGDYEGQRSDVMIYVSISEERDAVSLVSLPRDLLVNDNGRQPKLTDTFVDGPDRLIRVIRENFGLPVNHYAAVSFGGFIEAVRTLGSVEICLDEPLVDWRAEADFTAGCHDMQPAEALSYVRSRQGEYGDFERIDRQQTFIRAVLSELVSARILANPPRLFELTEDVAGNLTTDEDLQISTMLGLAQEMRQVVSDDMPMGTVPAYPRRIDGLDYMIAYAPGAEAMFRALREGRPLADPGTRDEREDTEVAIYDGGRATGAGIVRSTLAFAGFEARRAGQGPERLDAGTTTVVHPVGDEDERAGWVAAVLGAEVRPLLPGIEPPEGAHVVVATGEDAAG